MDFERFLEELGDVKRPLTTTRLTRLASLSSEEMGQLTSHWPRIDAARKERIVRLLIELAEDDVELNFEQVFRLCLDDPSPAVRVAGIEGFFECDERWLIDRLILQAHGDESEEVRAAAATALGRFALMAELGDLGTRDAAKIDEALLSIFENKEESVDVRRRAIESLGVRSGDRVAAAINESYASDNIRMRLGAIYAMGRNCDEKWLDVILSELKNPEAEMRYEAVNACGEIEDQRCVPYLAPLLKDKDMQVRLLVIGALGHIGGPRAKEELVRLQQHPDEQMREAAEEALEELAFNDDPFSFGFDRGVGI